MAFDSILLVGCGNMAGAMLDGWLAAGVSPSRFTVVEPSGRALPNGVEALLHLPEERRFDAVLLGVKPQILAEVAPQVARLVDGRTVVLSVLAGVETAVLAAQFSQAAGVVRIMPNLSAALGKSPMALAAAGLDEDGKAEAFALLKPLGTPEWIGEDQFDLVTALAGSGPAFVYRFIDGLAEAAVKLGLPADQAQRLALATVEGASALAAGSEHSPAELARRVASPGGTTQAGLNAMDQGGKLGEVLLATLQAARDRSAEMAEDARKTA